MRVLFTIRSLTGGGAERVVSVLSGLMAQRGIETYIVAYARTDKDYELDEKVKVLIMPERKDGLLTKFLRIPDMRKLVKEIKPDVVIPFVGTVLYVTWFAIWGLKTKFVLTIRNNPWVMPASLKERKLRDWIAKKSDAIMIQNEEQGNYFSLEREEKIFTVSNPIQKKFMENGKDVYSEEIKKVISVGRLEPQKNHRLLISAFAKAYADEPQIKLYIYGDGREENSLRGFIEELGLQEKVYLMGRATNMLQVLKEADLFVMTSDYEGMPNALMEAMVVGVPCISTDCKTGPKTLIKEQDNGILVPIRDEERLIEALEWAIDNPDLMNKMGMCARKYMCDNFTEEKSLSAVIRMLERINIGNEVN